MKRLVQFSTGLGSAEVARRSVENYGVENVILLTADTLVEDEDNWRFAHEARALLGNPEWFIATDGRTPMQAGRDARVVPNNRFAVCSRILKRELLRDWIDANCDPAEVIIQLGFDWTEPQRHEAAAPLLEAVHRRVPPNAASLLPQASADDRMGRAWHSPATALRLRIQPRQLRGGVRPWRPGPMATPPHCQPGAVPHVGTRGGDHTPAPR